MHDRHVSGLVLLFVNRGRCGVALGISLFSLGLPRRVNLSLKKGVCVRICVYRWYAGSRLW